MSEQEVLEEKKIKVNVEPEKKLKKGFNIR